MVNRQSVNILILTACFVGFWSNSLGQYLNQVNQTDNAHNLIYQYFQNGNELVGAGTYQDTSWVEFGWNKLAFNKYDQNFIPSSNYYGDSMHFYITGSGFQYYKNAYYLSGYKTKLNDPDTTIGILVKYDTLGNVIWEKEYFTNLEDVRLFQIVQRDTSLLVSGSIYGVSTGGDTQAFLMKIDTNGNLNWVKYYTGNSQSPYGLESTTDGGFILSSRYNSGVGNYKTVAYKLDSLGNIQWFKVVGGSLNSHGCKFIQMPSGNYLGYGNSQDPLNSSARSWLIELNQSGTVVKDTIMNLSTGYDIFNTSNVQFKLNEMILLGYKYDNEFTSTGKAFLASVDYNFNITWLLEYHERNTENGFIHQIPLANGFTLISGSVYQDSPENTIDEWFLILDSVGCAYVNCNLGKEEIKNEFPKVYPNPTNDILHISMNGNHEQIKVRLFNFLGNEILMEDIEKDNTQLDVSSYSRGVYLLFITDHYGSMHIEKIVLE